MRKQIKLNVEIGDANYVKPGEYFAELTPDGKELSALKRRNDNLELVTVLTTSARLEAGTATKELSELSGGDTLVIEPSDGYDGLSKVTITFTDSSNQDVS